MSAKHEGHTPTTAAIFESDVTSEQVIVIVEHCGCTSWSRSVDPAAKRKIRAYSRPGIQWVLTDAHYSIESDSNPNYSISKITFKKG